ncbi:alpha-2,8-sialyltransferase 8B-like [Diadema antillarum]|uniref:alpha-2,8-sialyltransferase 8B-like n=1 Tax=Diadema antillarum TaxID=105358 RepID=UPI003A864C85
MVIFFSNPFLDVKPKVLLSFTPEVYEEEDGQRITLNGTAVQDVRWRIFNHLKRWQAIQIFKKDVLERDYNFERSPWMLRSRHRTRSIPTKNSCAVVGNGGVLLGSGCGELIDSFDFVIRMNLAPYGGEFSRDVGSRLHLMTVNVQQLDALIACTNTPPATEGEIADDGNCSSLLQRLRGMDGRILWFFKRPRDLLAMKDMLAKLRTQHHLNFSFAYSPSPPMTAAKGLWHVDFPSTGLALYTAATQFCRQIFLFGYYPFTKDARNRTVRYHYYEKRDINYNANAHNMPGEYRILSNLNLTGAVRLVNDCS